MYLAACEMNLTNSFIHREIGGAMMEFYPKCIPKMEDYDINVRVDVVGNLLIVGTQTNVHDLSMERHFLRFRNAVTIKVRQMYVLSRYLYQQES